LAKPLLYLVAGAIKVYSWKNKTRTNRDFREKLENFLKQNLTFSVRSMEKCLGDDSRKLAYYYISKLLKKKIIRKTNKYEKQGYAQKPLIIYEVIK